jgi:hypothetical protein
MSVAYDILLAMNKQTWNKWDYVCATCDGLVEMTLKSEGLPHAEMCPRCSLQMTLLSVVDATIGNSTTKKEEQTMIDTPLSPAELYNPNALVTYKKIAGTFAEPEAPEYITDKVVDLEWRLHQGRTNLDEVRNYENKVNKLENILSSYCQEATDPDMELIGEIANLFDIRLTKDISFSGSISFSGTVTVDLTEDFDLDDLIQSNISVDAYNGDIEINDYSVEDVREDY